MLKMTAIVAGSKYAARLKKVQKEWKKALSEEGNTIGKLYDKTYHNWKSPHKPKQSTRIRTTGDEWYVEIKLKGRIYWFVHESIDRLRAVFSDDWSPKTERRVLASGSGSGRMVYASKSIDLDPYEAREFTEAIIKIRTKPFQKRMERATREGVVKALTGK